MNVLFIGGSNLVIRQGISTLIPKALLDAGEEVSNVYNIAVGATPCLFGYENLTLFRKKDIDVIFIEYGINDLPLFVNDRLLWEKAFDGLISLAKKKYPSAQIVTIVLGRQKERFWKNQQRMHQKMTAISGSHGALVVNVDEILKRKINTVDEFEKFYLDDSHYSSPNVTQYISDIVVGEYLLSRSLGFFDSIKKIFAAKKELKLQSLSGLVECFENSRFHKQTTILDKNETLEIKVKGIPVAISFSSTSESCSLLIEVNGYKKIINTRRKKVGRLSFVLKQIPLYGFLEKNKGQEEENIVKITAIDEQSALWDESVMQRTYGMISASEKTQRVYISHVCSL